MVVQFFGRVSDITAFWEMTIFYRQDGSKKPEFSEDISCRFFLAESPGNFRMNFSL